MISRQNFQEHKKGIIFSCNDKVYEWVITFLESVRDFNPDIPLVLIPYDDNCERVIALSNKFNFSIFDCKHQTHSSVKRTYS